MENPPKQEKKIDDQTIKDIELQVISNDPLKLVEDGFLHIKTKKAELIRLKLNKCQQSLLSVIRKLKDNNLPIRMWVLKARQEGVSTVTEAIIYAFSSMKDNINSLIMADEIKHSDNLFEMSKLYNEMLTKKEPHLSKEIKRSNEKKLMFEGNHSQIIIATADNIDAARSHTYHLVHLSECGFFRDLPGVMAALNRSVPLNEKTMIIGETTANGMNDFYKEWKRAIEGKSDWVALFIPWFWMDEYRYKLKDGKMYPTDGIIFNDSDTLERFMDEERQLKEDHNLDDEQLNYRRWSITNDCAGDINRFRQEMPATWEEAFIMSGSKFFDTFGLKQQMHKKRKPVAIGDIFYCDGQFEFRELPFGKVKIYEWPDPTSEYIVTGDSSEALGLDEASAFVGNKRTNLTAAVINGQYPPEELAEVVRLTAEFYNRALAVIENKGYGYMSNQMLYKKYGNVYHRTKNRDGNTSETTEIGFNTNSASRPEMLGRFAEEIRLNNTTLYDEDLIDQCKTFVINPKSKKAEGSSGCQDGLVICRSIFSQVRSEYPFRSKQPERNKSKQRAIQSARDRVMRKPRYGTKRKVG